MRLLHLRKSLLASFTTVLTRNKTGTWLSRWCRPSNYILLYLVAIGLSLALFHQSKAGTIDYWLAWLSFESGGQSRNGGYTLHQVIGAPVVGTQQGGGYTLTIGMANPAGTASLTVTPSLTPTPTPTPTPIKSVTPTHTPTSSSTVGDTYENDDACAQASTISATGEIQQHTFHENSDVDWVQFPVTAGVEYKITVRVPGTSDLDVILDLYEQCDSSTTETYNPSFSPEVRAKVKARTSGQLYLRLLNHHAIISESTAGYELSVHALTGDKPLGALIIVAGFHKHNDDLQPYIYNVTDRIYQLWRGRGYAAAQIYYLAVDQNRDPSEDGDSDVNDLPTIANLQHAITTWAFDKVGPDRPLTLYLVDHGEYDQFFLNNPQNQILRPQDLDKWLDQLETALPGTPINVIIEACKSGSFIATPNSISGENRVVVTSTEARALAYGDEKTKGIVFSDAFLSALAQGHSFYEAFIEARESATYHNHDQIPWIDDNGDGLANQREDGNVAIRRTIIAEALSGDELWAPSVISAEVRTTAGERRELWAHVLDDHKVETVWAAVYPPSYIAPESGAELTLGPLPLQLLAREEDWFGALLGPFDEIGDYRIVFYAVDELGLHSRPREILVSTGNRLFLPIVVR